MKGCSAIYPLPAYLLHCPLSTLEPWPNQRRIRWPLIDPYSTRILLLIVVYSFPPPLLIRSTAVRLPVFSASLSQWFLYTFLQNQFICGFPDFYTRPDWKGPSWLVALGSKATSLLLIIINLLCDSYCATSSPTAAYSAACEQHFWDRHDFSLSRSQPQLSPHTIN